MIDDGEILLSFYDESSLFRTWEASFNFEQLFGFVGPLSWHHIYEL